MIRCTFNLDVSRLPSFPERSAGIASQQLIPICAGNYSFEQLPTPYRLVIPLSGRPTVGLSSSGELRFRSSARAGLYSFESTRVDDASQFYFLSNTTTCVADKIDELSSRINIIVVILGFLGISI
jgi:hypothetical protein